jgi:hypothetical protein
MSTKKKPKTYTLAEAIARAKADPKVRIAPESWRSNRTAFWSWDGAKWHDVDGSCGEPDHVSWRHHAETPWRVWRMVPRPTRAELAAVEAEAKLHLERRLDTLLKLGNAQQHWWQAMQTGRYLVAKAEDERDEWERAAKHWRTNTENALGRAEKAEAERDEAKGRCTGLHQRLTWSNAECTRLRGREAELEARAERAEAALAAIPRYPLLELLHAHPGREVRSESECRSYRLVNGTFLESMFGASWSRSSLEYTDAAATDWRLVDEAPPAPVSPWVDCDARTAREKYRETARVKYQHWGGWVSIPSDSSELLDIRLHRRNQLLCAPDDETGWQWAPALGGES